MTTCFYLCRIWPSFKKTTERTFSCYSTTHRNHAVPVQPAANVCEGLGCALPAQSEHVISTSLNPLHLIARKIQVSMFN